MTFDLSNWDLHVEIDVWLFNVEFHSCVYEKNKKNDVWLVHIEFHFCVCECIILDTSVRHVTYDLSVCVNGSCHVCVSESRICEWHTRVHIHVSFTYMWRDLFTYAVATVSRID